jgi:hypothetical protein
MTLIPTLSYNPIELKPIYSFVPCFKRQPKEAVIAASKTLLKYVGKRMVA